jgi:hypothetical protein
MNGDDPRAMAVQNRSEMCRFLVEPEVERCRLLMVNLTTADISNNAGAQAS